MLYLDLFSGCGGLAYGFHQAGWKAVFAVEKNADAFLTLEHNLIRNSDHFVWPEWLPIKNLDINELLEQYTPELKKLRGKIDLIAGGPPCQGFSIAGRRDSTDIRNKLVFSYIEMVKLIAPKMIVFENVKGFLHSINDNNETSYASVIQTELAKLGYLVQPELLNFAEFGIPQKRTRFILFGIRKEFSNSIGIKPKAFFQQLQTSRESFLKSKKLGVTVSLREAISDLLGTHGTINSPDSSGFKQGCYGSPESSYQRLMRKRIRTNAPVNSHRFARHSQVVIERFKIAIEKKLKPYEYKAFFNLKKSSTKLLDENLPTPTLTTLPDDYIHFQEPRILTVREYARIQSFPDCFEFKGNYTTGANRRKLEVPRYSQIGNAIPPLFAELAGKILLGFLK